MLDKQFKDEGAVARRFALFPSEIFIAIFGCLAFILYTGLDVPFRAPVEVYVRHVKICVAFYFVGLFLSLFFVRLADLNKSLREKGEAPWKATWEKYRILYLRPRLVVDDLRFLISIPLLFFIFIQLKHLIPLVNPSLYDGVLLKVDRLVFWGETSGEWLHDILGYDYATFLSDGYLLFFYYELFCALIFVLQRDQSLRAEFFTAFVLLWYVGILIVYCFPTLGPCFHVPDLFSNIPACKVTEVKTVLWEHKLFLDKFPKDERGIYAISAFPSLHLAAPILGALYLRRFSMFLSWLSWLFAALTVITTLYFGWHYFLDDVGSFLLVFLVMRITRFIFDREILGSKKASRES